MLLLLLMSLISCSKKHCLIIDYSNSTGNNPDAYYVKSSKKVDFDDQYPNANNSDNQTVTVIIDDLKIGDKSDNYVISNYTISECYNEKGKCKKKDWKIQAEFDKDDSYLKTNISAVLVLDVSESLHGNIDRLKSYAKNFAKSILRSSPSSSVAVVMFSKEIKTFDFVYKNEFGEIANNIDSYTNYKDRTTLYGASIEGLRLLGRSNYDGAKNLIIFTDGGDNNSDNPFQLRDEIVRSDINRFAIGLKGRDFDKKALEELASKKGNFVVAKDFDDLEGAFETIAKQVATVYKLDYKRSD